MLGAKDARYRATVSHEVGLATSKANSQLGATMASQLYSELSSDRGRWKWRCALRRCHDVGLLSLVEAQGRCRMQVKASLQRAGY